MRKTHSNLLDYSTSRHAGLFLEQLSTIPPHNEAPATRTHDLVGSILTPFVKPKDVTLIQNQLEIRKILNFFMAFGIKPHEPIFRIVVRSRTMIPTNLSCQQGEIMIPFRLSFLELLQYITIECKEKLGFVVDIVKFYSTIVLFVQFRSSTYCNYYKIK